MKLPFFTSINILLILLCVDIQACISQSVGIGTASPNASAVLDMNSTNKGVLVPRIALTAANVAAPVSSPADALLIFNTASSGSDQNAVSLGFYYWSSATSRWKPINSRSVSNSIGYGTWGDCSANNISDYNPAVDTTGANGDNFGYSSAISGNFAIVGAYQDNVAGNMSQGSASIYQFDGSNWVIFQKLTDPSGLGGDLFGCSVSISGNFAIIGAEADDILANGADEGTASIYHYDGNSWVFMQKLTDPTGGLSDFFGISVSISGNYAIIGAYKDDGPGAFMDAGSASIFHFDGTSWVFMQKITDATGAASDYYGWSVSISGNYVVVGAYNDDFPAPVVADQGSISIYHYSGMSWDLMQKITDATGAAGDLFGYSVSISGNYVIAGAFSDDVGPNMNQGSASIYFYNGTSWILMQKLTDPNGGLSDSYGQSVSITGSFACIGAPGDDIGVVTNQGSAFIYQKVGLGWQKVQYVTDPAGSGFDFFGSSTAIDNTNKRFLIGAFGYVNSSGKVVFGKIN